MFQISPKTNKNTRGTIKFNPLAPEIIIAVTPWYGINLLKILHRTSTTLAIHSTQNIHAFELKLSIIAQWMFVQRHAKFPA